MSARVIFLSEEGFIDFKFQCTKFIFVQRPEQIQDMALNSRGDSLKHPEMFVAAISRVREQETVEKATLT